MEVCPHWKETQHAAARTTKQRGLYKICSLCSPRYRCLSVSHTHTHTGNKLHVSLIWQRVDESEGDSSRLSETESALIMNRGGNANLFVFPTKCCSSVGWKQETISHTHTHAQSCWPTCTGFTLMLSLINKLSVITVWEFTAEVNCVEHTHTHRERERELCNQCKINHYSLWSGHFDRPSENALSARWDDAFI